jgi:surfeit locus 1 family protein
MTRSRRGFRPALWPTLFTIPAVLFMVGLGVWQLERRTWKWELIETRKARISAPVVDLPGSPDPATAEYRRVRLRGRFLHDREMYLGGRSRRGVVGYHIVTPMALSAGGSVLVDRGWVPLRYKTPATRRAGLTAGAVSLVGHLRLAGRKSRLIPDNDPAKNFWFTIDVPAMAAHAKLTGVRPYYVQAAGPVPPGGWPQPTPVRVDLPNDHLKYAFTWFVLAAALMVIYVVYHRGRQRE